MKVDENPVKHMEPSQDSQLGAEMAPEVPKDPKDMTMEEKTIHAVEFLQSAIPAARNMIHNGTLTGVQAKRVLAALIESPLENETPAFTTIEAKKIFNLACIIQNAKYLLFQGAPSMLSEVEKKAAEEKALVEAEQYKSQQDQNKLFDNNNEVKE